jgi:hypothetical protein
MEFPRHWISVSLSAPSGSMVSLLPRRVISRFWLSSMKRVLPRRRILVSESPSCTWILEPRTSISVGSSSPSMLVRLPR